MFKTVRAIRFLFMGPLVLVMLFVINLIDRARSLVGAVGRARNRDRLVRVPAPA